MRLVRSSSTAASFALAAACFLAAVQAAAAPVFLEIRPAVVPNSEPGPPPPPPSPYIEPLPFVTRIAIGPLPEDPNGGRICAGAGILVSVEGSLPDECLRFTGLELLPSPSGRPTVEPPILRIGVEDVWCPPQPCLARIQPFAARIALPPLPARDYVLPVQLRHLRCVNGALAETLFYARVPFRVESCGTASPCLLGRFAGPVRSSEPCDATVSPDRPAQLFLYVSSEVALAGLQGQMVLNPPGLAVTSLVLTGPASGMHLSWAATREGAQFVMFADQGAPIPPGPRPGDPFGIPVLQATFSQRPGTTAPELTRLLLTDLFGADSSGAAVPMCPTFEVPTATICSGQVCDFNGDGHVDVRDLVLMVRCLNQVGACADSSRLDCNRDGRFTLDDVLCCALTILHRPPCIGCPPDTVPPRREPSARMELGVPSLTDAGVDLPIRLEGAALLGAARLGLNVPLDRYSLSSVELTAGASEWLELHDVVDGEVVIGLIRSSPSPARPEAGSVGLVAHFALKPGQERGGEARAAACQFSGPDGAMLAIEMDTPARPLGLPATLSLSAARPNPFSDGVKFTVSVDRSGEASVGVYDLSGRLVASLFRGRLDPGVHDFGWDGRRDSGDRARDGVYFYRASVHGQTAARKMVLSRGR